MEKLTVSVRTLARSNFFNAATASSAVKPNCVGNCGFSGSNSSLVLMRTPQRQFNFFASGSNAASSAAESKLIESPCKVGAPGTVPAR